MRTSKVSSLLGLKSALCSWFWLRKTALPSVSSVFYADHGAYALGVVKHSRESGHIESIGGSCRGATRGAQWFRAN